MAQRKLSLFFKCLLIGIFSSALFFSFPSTAFGQDQENASTDPTEILIKEVMEKSNIPGATVIIIYSGDVSVKNYGFANIEKKIPFTPETLFEIGSCSKSFVALGVLKLVEDGMLKLDDPVSKYFPSFKPKFRGEPQEITINQLLHHTSGLDTKTFAQIPPGTDPQALSNVVNMMSDADLVFLPRRQFIYCNTNYDIAGAVIEVASGMKFEDYMVKNVFRPLGMNNTTVLFPNDDNKLATGYKMAFNEPVPYDAPRYRGNAPAGYIITNTDDMVTYLKAQLELSKNPFKKIIQDSHMVKKLLQGENRFRTILYTYGWQADTNTGLLFHGGMNPNYSGHIILDTATQTAVAVFTNYSNSRINGYLANRIYNQLTGQVTGDTTQEYESIRELDGPFSLATYALTGFLCVILVIFLYMLFDTIRGVRAFEAFNLKKLVQLIVALLGTVPLLAALYYFPRAVQGMDWSNASVWGPASLPTALTLFFVFLGSANLVFLYSQLFPYKDQTSFRNKYVKPLPMILFLGFIGGLAGSASMFLISTSILPRFIQLPVAFLILYIGIALLISVYCQKIVQTRMVNITNNIVFGLRMRLINKIFATRYQRFEKLESGRVYATLNNDTEAIAGSAGMVVGIISNVVTAVAAFFYLSAISLPATLATLGFGMVLGVFYIIVGKKARVLMEEMRDTQNKFMTLIEGLVKGFREISLHHNKKIEYEADVEGACAKYRDTRISAVVKLINANIIAGSAMTLLMAAVCITFPRIFPDMNIGRLISFIMILMWMLGPVMSIMSSVPTFIRIKVSWDRIQKFIAEIPAIEELMNYKEIEALSHKGETVDSLEVKDVHFAYPGEEDKEGFSVGPLDMKAKKGDIVFIVGGNGSGKTTLAKIMTGLYQPDEGEVLINGKTISGEDYLGEYFSVIFGDFQLFEKLYNVEMDGNEDKIRDSLEILELQGKVDVKKGSFSTIDLSGGQRKRLALLQCWLENCPIYLFDEVAADQDPEFRKFFYRDLLPRMKEEGKIVICITHDDHYFDVADQIIKMDMGKIDNQVTPAALSGTTSIITTGAGKDEVKAD